MSAMDEDDPVFSHGLEKLYYLSALDDVNGVGVLAYEADAAQLAHDLMQYWRYSPHADQLAGMKSP